MLLTSYYGKLTFHWIGFVCVLGVDTRKGNWVNINSIKEADRQKEIVTLCWGNDEETEVGGS